MGLRREEVGSESRSSDSNGRRMTASRESTAPFPVIRTRCLGHLAFLAAWFGWAEIAAAQSTTLMSVDSSGNNGDHDSVGASISSDGRWAAFVSESTNLVAGDSNNKRDVFVHDQVSGNTERTRRAGRLTIGRAPPRSPPTDGSSRSTVTRRTSSPAIRTAGKTYSSTTG